MKLDSTDLQILELLQKDGSLSSVEIAEAVGKSQSLVWRRIMALETSGTIKRRTALVDRQAVGLDLLVHILVTLNDQRRETVAAFAETVVAIPEIIQCHMLMGDIDFLLLAVVRDLASYRDLLRERLSVLPGVRGIDSRVVVEEIKNTAELPLNAASNGRSPVDAMADTVANPSAS